MDHTYYCLFGTVIIDTVVVQDDNTINIASQIIKMCTVKAMIDSISLTCQAYNYALLLLSQFNFKRYIVSAPR